MAGQFAHYPHLPLLIYILLVVMVGAVLQTAVQELGDEPALLQSRAAAVLSHDGPLLLVNLLENGLGEVAAQPFPLGGRAAQKIFVDIEVVNEEGLAHSVNNHAHGGVVEGKLQ